MSSKISSLVACATGAPEDELPLPLLEAVFAPPPTLLRFSQPKEPRAQLDISAMTPRRARRLVINDEMRARAAIRG
jgi:hypothetical protein